MRTLSTSTTLVRCTSEVATGECGWSDWSAKRPVPDPEPGDGPAGGVRGGGALAVQDGGREGRGEADPQGGRFQPPPPSQSLAGFMKRRSGTIRREESGPRLHCNARKVGTIADPSGVYQAVVFVFAFIGVRGRGGRRGAEWGSRAGGWGPRVVPGPQVAPGPQMVSPPPVIPTRLGEPWGDKGPRTGLATRLVGE